MLQIVAASANLLGRTLSGYVQMFSSWCSLEMNNGKYDRLLDRQHGSLRPHVLPFGTDHEVVRSGRCFEFRFPHPNIEFEPTPKSHEVMKGLGEVHKRSTQGSPQHSSGTIDA